ncbi:proteasome adapter and scaffold protein ECM29-like isoform X2 [Artemia franciscana]|uniref:proteasome adapter and scaffold protein ECM29-like isoform X2 n=1 Tax=Artemia franciscana TaxID=6661 RepID=UPI0032DA2AA1
MFQSLGPTGQTTLPPGFSNWSYNRVAGEVRWSAEELEKAKMAVTRFIISGLFDERKIMIHGTIAMADTRFAVSSIASSYMFRVMSSKEWKDEDLIRSLYSLCLGSVPEQSPVLDVSIGQPQCTEKDLKPEKVRLPICRRVKLKLLPLLRKGAEMVIIMPDILFLIYDCIFGIDTTTNLRSSGLLLLQDLLWYSDDNLDLEAVAPSLLKLTMFMIGNLKYEGDNALKDFYNFKPDNHQRVSALTVLSYLAKKSPGVLADNADCIRMLLSSLEKEPDIDFAQSLRTTISGIAPCFISASETTKRLLKFVFNQYITSSNVQVRRVLVELVRIIFPITDVEGRFLLLICCGDRDETIAKDAVDALFGPLRSYTMDDRSTEKMETDKSDLVPSYGRLLNYIIEQKKFRESSEKGIFIKDRVVGFDKNTFEYILRFVQLSLINEAGLGPFESALENPHRVASSIRPFLLNLIRNESSVLSAHLALLTETVELFPSLNFITSLTILVGAVPEFLAGELVTLIPNLKDLTESNSEDTRLISAELLSIVLKEEKSQNFQNKFLSAALPDLSRKSVEGKQGLLFAIGFLLGRMSLKNENINPYSQIVDTIIELIYNEEHSLITSGAIHAIGQLARCKALKKTLKKDAELVQRLSELSCHAKYSIRIHDRAISALGFLSLEDSFVERRLLVNELLKIMREVKDVDLHFSIGESLVCCCFGATYRESRDLWSIKEDDSVKGETESEDFEFILEELIKGAGSQHPSVRQACTISLLAILRKCGNSKTIVNYIDRIQTAFAVCLAEGNDFVQDVSSKGLGLIYDFSPEEKRQELVDDLMSVFISGSRRRIQVSNETKIFEEGTLGPMPTGGQVTTYKELCSLASDLNQPDLVYKFMNLANNTMLWNSKKGAAFGFAFLTPKLGKELEKIYPVLIPKLYRYRFDPTPRVQNAMSAIWSSVVNDDTKTVDTYQKQIFEDISKHLTSNQWRVRESSCYASAELFRGRGFDAVLEKMPEFFRNILKVMDDVKESVRKSAEFAAKSIVKVLIQTTNVDAGKNSAQETAKFMFPVVLEGLQSSVKEVHALCLDTTISMVRSLGHLVAPHLPIIIPALINSVEAAHHQQLNYMSVRLGDQAATQEMFDSARISAARMTTSYETAQHTLQFLDAEKTEIIVISLLSTIKTNNPLPVKGCSAHLISSLAQLRPNELQPVAGKALAVLCKGLSDRNLALRSTYAGTIGQLVRVAKDSSIEKLLNMLQTWYLETNEESIRSACMQTIQAVSRYNPDVLRNHAGTALSLVFLGMHGKSDDPTIKGWEKVWEEIAPGTEGGIRFYLDEIVKISKMALNAASYPLRAQGAKCQGKIAKTMGQKLDEKVSMDLLNGLKTSMGGKVWTGKEEVVTAFADVIECIRFDESVSDGSELMDLILREIKRGNKDYKSCALSACGRIAASLKFKKFSLIIDATEPIIIPPKEEEDEEIDQKELLDLQIVAIEALGKAWPEDRNVQVEFFEKLMKLIEFSMSNVHWKIQLATVKSLQRILETLDLTLFTENTDALLKFPIYYLGHAMQTSLKLDSMKAIETIVQKMNSINLTLDEFKSSSIKKLVEEQSRTESADLRLKCDSLLRLLRS